MRTTRARWFAWLTDWTIRLAGDRPEPADLEQRRRRMSYAIDTHRMGVRWTERLRDRLRRRWLRVRRAQGNRSD